MGEPTGWRRLDGIPPYGYYYAWDAAEPDLVPWVVHVACGMGLDRPATHWHPPMRPEAPRDSKTGPTVPVGGG